MRAIALISFAALALAVTGCGSGQPASSAASAPPVSAPTPSHAPVTPTPSTPRESHVGATQVNKGDGYAIKIKVLQVRQPLTPVLSGLNRKGFEYAAAEVRACIAANSTGEALTFSWYPWSLVTTNGTVVEELSSWSEEWWNVSLYPNDSGNEHPIPTGRCVTGWIPFEVPQKSRLQYVDYNPSEGNALEWRIG